MYVGYSTNYYPYFHYILILKAHCIIPIDLLPLPILTGNRTSHHACLKRLASRRHMQTQLDTKSSLIASRLPALVVTVCFLFVWILGVLWDFSFLRWEVEVFRFNSCIYLRSCLSVCHPLVPCVSFSSSPSFCIHLIYISLPTEGWRSLFLFPSTFLSLPVSLL